MKAVVLTDEGLALREVPVSEPKPNEILVKVAASGLNRADLIMAAGRPHGSLGGAGAIAGLEWAGEVAAVGADVPEFRPGDQVNVLGRRRLCRVCRHRLGPGLSRTQGRSQPCRGGDAAHRTPDHARRAHH